MTREHLIQWVEARIDEVLTSENIIESPVNIIDQELDPSAVYILRNARREALFSTVRGDKQHHASNERTDVPTRVIKNDDGSGVIILPTDFLRFVSLQMNDWNRPLTKLISQDDELYKRQFNTYQRGSTSKPVGALVDYTGEYSTDEKTPVAGQGPNAVQVNQAIEFFTSPEGVIKTFTYVPRLKAEQMPVDLIDAMVWYAASRTLFILKRFEEAQVADANGVKLLAEIKFGIDGE
jgi:hypothetical protein